MDKLWYLKRIHIFRCLDADSLERLKGVAMHKRYQRGEIIFGPDDPGDSIYLLKEGRVKLCRFDERGKEIILAILEEGEFFGEEALTGGERGGGYAECLESALIGRISTAEFERLMAENAELATMVARQMMERLLGARAQIESLAFQDVSSRLAAALLQLAQRHGVATEDGATRIDLRLTHQDLANLIASTRETTTSLLSRFKREGMLETDGRWLMLRRDEEWKKAAGRG
jgi:CRP-like cAMP-binding protein